MLIGIKVTADAREESIEKVSDVRYLIAVTEPAEDNRANDRILAIFRNMYPRTQIKIVSGHHAPSKVISVGVDT